jgi:hypothetical protein
MICRDAIPRALRRLAVAAAAVTALGVFAPPASANDTTLNYYKNGLLVARATWDDLHDTLCVEVLSSPFDTLARAGIGPVSGSGPEFRIDAVAGTVRKHCTGNLSIPEDRLYFVQIWYQLPGGPPEFSRKKQFYT